MESLNGLWVPPKPHRISYIINQIKSYINILMYYIISLLKTGEESFSRPHYGLLPIFLGDHNIFTTSFFCQVVKFHIKPYRCSWIGFLGPIFYGFYHGIHHLDFCSKHLTIKSKKEDICFSCKQGYNHKAICVAILSKSANSSIPMQSWWTLKFGCKNRGSKKWKHRWWFQICFMLGGGFQCFLFSPLPGEMIQFD